jgi:hypothetical protein
MKKSMLPLVLQRRKLVLQRRKLLLLPPQLLQRSR